jgi:ATP-dependent Clp protease ATP-binding subunit ClpC
MTSNIGARYLQKRNQVGFTGTSKQMDDASAEAEVQNEVKRVFNPEFLNRVDEIIIFSSLSDDDLLKIINLMVGQINKTLERKDISIRLTREAAAHILEKTCGDRNYGARPLRRALQKFIEDPLAEALIQGVLPKPADLEIFLEADGLYYRELKESESDEGEGGVAIGQGTPLIMFS